MFFLRPHLNLSEGVEGSGTRYILQSVLFTERLGGGGIFFLKKKGPRASFFILVGNYFIENPWIYLFIYIPNPVFNFYEGVCVPGGRREENKN